MVTRTSKSARSPKATEPTETPRQPARITGKAPHAAAKTSRAKAAAKSHSTRQQPTDDRVEAKPRKKTTRVKPADDATRAYASTGSTRPEAPHQSAPFSDRAAEIAMGEAFVGLFGALLLGVASAIEPDPRTEAHFERAADKALDAIDDLGSKLFGGIFDR